MEKGDHLISGRTVYTHHGLYVGDGKVIHYAGGEQGFGRGSVELTSLAEFQGDGDLRVKYPTFRVYGKAESVERAYSRLGEDAYSLLFNNCEHFVNWCIFGVKYSQQVVSGLGYVCVPAYLTATRLRKSQTMWESARLVAAGSGGVATATTVSTTSTNAGFLAGTVAGGVTSAITGGTLTGGGTAALLSGGLAVTGLSAVALPLAVSVAVGYGVKKFWDWL